MVRVVVLAERVVVNDGVAFADVESGLVGTYRRCSSNSFIHSK